MPSAGNLVGGGGLKQHNNKRTHGSAMLFVKIKVFFQEEYRNSMPASSFQQQKLRVCEVCSAYLGLHDNDRRLADHFGGKLHLGFIQIREKLDQLKVRPSLWGSNLTGSILRLWISSQKGWRHTDIWLVPLLLMVLIILRRKLLSTSRRRETRSA